MPVSKAQQKATAKYVKQNYDRIEIKVPKGRKAQFQEYADRSGESLNGFINRAIAETIVRDGAGKPTDALVRDSGIPIPPPQRNASQAVSAQVKAHIMKTGEDAAAFLERATESTIKRDEISLRMGINPATCEKEDLSNE